MISVAARKSTTSSFKLDSATSYNWRVIDGADQVYGEDNIQNIEQDYVILLASSASFSNLKCSSRTSFNFQKLCIKNDIIRMLAQVPITVAVIIAVRDQYLSRAV